MDTFIAQKARQSKGKARLAAYDKLLNEEVKNRKKISWNW